MTQLAENTIVGVTPLPPGWFNKFYVDGDPQYRPCPAIVLQVTVIDEDIDGYITRQAAFFADWDEYGALHAASDPENYAGTSYLPDLLEPLQVVAL